MNLRLHTDRSATATRVVDGFRSRFGRQPELLVRAPGRVALLGAHIDYSDGWVMPAAIERAVWLAVAGGRAGSRANVIALDRGELDIAFDRAERAGVDRAPGYRAADDSAVLDLDNLPPPLAERSEAGLRWSDYPAAMAWAWRDRGGTLPAFDAAYGSDLPIGAGVSSSAAVEMAFFLAFRALAEDLPAPVPIERYEGPALCRRAENQFLGVQSGIMDPFACLHGRANHLLLLDCRTLAHREIALPAEAEVVVFDSGVRRRLKDSGFNDRRAECRRAVELLREGLPSIRALRDVTLEELARHEHRLPPVLQRRARHAVEECARVRHAARALRAADLDAFGAAMVESHASSRELYEVSVDELDFLVETAVAEPGCWGAKLMGGGFGGCAAALVRAGEVDSVVEPVVGRFAARFGRRPAWFASPLADGARVERLPPSGASGGIEPGPV